MQRPSLWIFPALLAVIAAPLAFAAGTGSSGGAPAAPSGPSAEPRSVDPMEAARRLYDDGVKLVQRAEKAGADPKKVTKDYVAALKKFEAAVQLNPQLAEGWNYVGYTRRQSGDAGGALGAYDEALRLKPGFAEALEYRGVAYLGVGRLDDSKRDYLDLFGRDRQLAATLLAAIKSWSGKQRAAGALDGTAASALDAWISEREKLAAQTAAMTRAGSGSGWN